MTPECPSQRSVSAETGGTLFGDIFESGGADVTVSWRQGGHEFGEDDIHAAKTWLSREKIRKKVAA